jgi:hypothetical protein
MLHIANDGLRLASSLQLFTAPLFKGRREQQRRYEQ